MPTKRTVGALNVGRTGTARPIPPENNSTGRGGFQARSGPSPKFAAKLGQHAQIVPVGVVGGLPLLAVAVGPLEDIVVLGTIVDLVLSDCSLMLHAFRTGKRDHGCLEVDIDTDWAVVRAPFVGPDEGGV